MQRSKYASQQHSESGFRGKILILSELWAVRRWEHKIRERDSDDSYDPPCISIQSYLLYLSFSLLFSFNPSLFVSISVSFVSIVVRTPRVFTFVFVYYVPPFVSLVWMLVYICQKLAWYSSQREIAPPLLLAALWTAEESWFTKRARQNISRIVHVRTINQAAPRWLWVGARVARGRAGAALL